jgi:hypothetical protein
LKIWTIYENPSDYPGKFVVRVWEDDGPEQEPAAVVDSLAQARAAIPGGLMPFKRHPGDDPTIVETWL